MRRDKALDGLFVWTMCHSGSSNFTFLRASLLSLCSLMLCSGCALVQFHRSPPTKKTKTFSDSSAMARLNSNFINADSGHTIQTHRRKIPMLPAPQLVMNSAVQREMRYLLKGNAAFVRASLDRFEPNEKIIREILRDEGMPEELMALAMIESGFNHKARSPMGAVGIWQFIKSTAENYGLSVGQVTDDRKDLILSTLAAARHLKDLYEIYGDWYLALAAYNAGPGTVDRLMARLGTNDFWEISRSGRLCQETTRYVPKFIAAAIIMKNPKRYGFEQEVALDSTYQAPSM